MWRYLPGNAGCEGPREIICIDTETTRTPRLEDDTWSDEQLRLGVARSLRYEGGKATCQKVFAFNNCDQFWSWLARRVAGRSVNWVFAHGMGFDLRALGWGLEVDSRRLRLQSLPRESLAKDGTPRTIPPRQGMLVLDSPPTIVDSWFPGGAHLRFVDTRNWWNCSLASLGEELGLAKLPMPDPWESDETWLEYCHRDCEIVERAVLSLLAWHKEFDLGVFKPTAPGQAFQVYKHRFNSHKIVLHDVAPVKKLERDAYYAGRLACFYSGIVDDDRPGWAGNPADGFDEHAPRPTGVVYHLDVTGLFPSVMRYNLYPKRLLEWAETGTILQGTSSHTMARSIACVSLSKCSASLPQRMEGRVNFCTGDFQTTLAGPELAAALTSSAQVTIESAAVYEVAELFTAYVDFFWQLRYMAKLAGREVEAGLCKLFLNSLYGKFAQRSNEWETVKDRVPPEAWHLWCEVDREFREVVEYRSIGETVQRRRDRGEHAESFTAISAFVTSYARLRMDALRSIAGWHNVYYQGVDSLYVSKMGLDRLQAAGEVDDCTLGKLRLIGESRKTHFRGNGYYCFDGQWVRTSIRRGAREIAIGSFEQDQFESLERSCSRQPTAGVAVCRVIRTIDPERHLPETTPNGWVRPQVGEPCVSLQQLSDVTSSCVPLCSVS